jgi:3',5'-cyclic AMP phosphodiesterase CpdA
MHSRSAPADSAREYAPKRQRIKIAHISDLHFVASVPSFLWPLLRILGVNGANQAALEALRNTFDQLKPDVVVVTGDLTSFGDHKSVNAALAYLNQLPRASPADSLFVVPGNHDVMKWYFRIGGRNQLQADAETLPSVRLVQRDETRLLICSFDSTADRSWRYWPRHHSRGRIRPEAFNRFNGLLAEERRRDSTAIDSAFRIAILHHHPLPIPGTQVKALTVMINGGTFVAHMQESGVNLVLHGHEHYPYTCTYCCDQSKDAIIVVAAGSVSQRSEHQNSFNFIEIEPGVSINVSRYRYREAGFHIDPEPSTVFRMRRRPIDRRRR